MPEIWAPEWLDSAHWYYSRIDDGSGRVENFVVDMSDVSSEFIDYVLKEGKA